MSSWVRLDAPTNGLLDNVLQLTGWWILWKIFGSVDWHVWGVVG